MHPDPVRFHAQHVCRHINKPSASTDRCSPVLAAEHPNDDRLMALMGHQRRFKRKSRTSLMPPLRTSGHIAAAHCSANLLTRDEARWGSSVSVR